MSTDMQKTERTRQPGWSRSEWAYGLAVGAPLLLVVITFLTGTLREARAKAHFESIVTRLTAEGLPTDNHSSTLSFDQRLSTNSSIGWLDVLIAQRELNTRFNEVRLTITNSEEMPRPGQPWDIEPLARRYTDQAKPIFAAMDKLIEDDRPVWQPLIWEGFETLLPEIQESRELVRLLAVEFRLAVQQGDQARAVHALEMIEGVIRAFDWQICLVADLVTMANRSTHRSLIQQSLEVGFWKVPQPLRDLHEQLSAGDDYDTRWLHMVAGEQAMLAAELSSGFEEAGVQLFPFGVPSTTKVNLLEKIRLAGEVTGVGTIDHVRAIEREIDQASVRATPPPHESSFTLVGLPFAYTEGPTGLLGNDFKAASVAYARDAMERRWTLTAVAIKQFQIEQGRWPSDLSELSDVGLSSSDWLAYGDNPFRYTVKEDEVILAAETPEGWGGAMVGWKQPDQADQQGLEVHIR